LKPGHATDAIDIAHDGREAVEAVQRATYDAILMDVHMPEMDGLAATRAIRARAPPVQQPYIIALTAATLQENVEQCRNAGMDAYIRKPVRLENLAEALAGVPQAAAPGS
jgi:CheY-like chemotaxis protein